MDPSFEKAVFSRKLNTVGEPVRTVYGWHIVEVLDRDTLKTRAGRDSARPRRQAACSRPTCATSWCACRSPTTTSSARASWPRTCAPRRSPGRTSPRWRKQYSHYAGPHGDDGDIGFLPLDHAAAQHPRRPRHRPGRRRDRGADQPGGLQHLPSHRTQGRARVRAGGDQGRAAGRRSARCCSARSSRNGSRACAPRRISRSTSPETPDRQVQEPANGRRCGSTSRCPSCGCSRAVRRRALAIQDGGAAERRAGEAEPRREARRPHHAGRARRLTRVRGGGPAARLAVARRRTRAGARSHHAAMMPRLVSLATAVPRTGSPRSRRRSSPATCSRGAERGRRPAARRVRPLGIANRNVCMPLDWLAADHGFAEKNALYVEHAVRLGREVAEAVMAKAGLGPRDIDHLVFVSSTGIAAPTVDARLANVLGLRGDLRRTPIWGLGCAGGCRGPGAGARVRHRRARHAGAADRARAVQPHLPAQRPLQAQSGRRLVVRRRRRGGTGGGRRAAAGGGNGRARSSWSPPRARFWPDTLDVMGWEVDGDGLHVVFARDIPTIVHERVRPGLAEFLGRHDLTLETLDHLVAHPGGMKVLAAYQQALGLAPDGTATTRARCCTITATCPRRRACSCCSASSRPGRSAPARRRCSRHSARGSAPSTCCCAATTA